MDLAVARLLCQRRVFRQLGPDKFVNLQAIGAGQPLDRFQPNVLPPACFDALVMLVGQAGQFRRLLLRQPVTSAEDLYPRTDKDEC